MVLITVLEDQDQRGRVQDQERRIEFKPINQILDLIHLQEVLHEHVKVQELLHREQQQDLQIIVLEEQVLQEEQQEVTDLNLEVAQDHIIILQEVLAQGAQSLEVQVQEAVLQDLQVLQEEAGKV